MFVGLLITFLVITALGYSMQTERNGGLISQHRYNNRDDDASGSREDHFG
jgi:hypothetical protein